MRLEGSQVYPTPLLPMYKVEGQKRKLDERAEAHLVAIACSDPPEGHAHWTLKLLADKAVELGYVESIARETMRQSLKKTNLSRGRTRRGASRN